MSSSSSNPSLPWLPRGWAGRRQAWPIRVRLRLAKVSLARLSLDKPSLDTISLGNTSLDKHTLARASPSRGRATQAPMARPSTLPRWRGASTGSWRSVSSFCAKPEAPARPRMRRAGKPRTP